LRYLFVQNWSGFFEQTPGQPETRTQLIEKKRYFLEWPIRGLSPFLPPGRK